MNTRIAVVTGANRGIGLEVCRQLAKDHSVILTARTLEKAQTAAETLRKSGLEVHAAALDLTNESSIREFTQNTLEQFGRIDVLVNNAAILLDESETVLEVSAEAIRATFETNLIGPWLLSQAVLPSMIKQRFGRVVNVSSSAGQLSGSQAWAPAYSASKTALNALTNMLSGASRGRNVLVNCVCPGWVRSDMGGPGASRSLQEGARGIVWAATLPDGGPNGGFFRDGVPLEW
jgi:NAD(P)-dependent dehydrogenase (short-subunit alcohol dehydrogenase family)